MSCDALLRGAAAQQGRELRGLVQQVVAELARSRRRGWATTVDELEVGLSGIAVPVFGPRGQVVGAVGVSGPTPRVQVRFDEVGPLLREHAAELTELLRGKTPEEAA